MKLGFFHILDGADHLLFLGCLVIPFRRLRSLIAVVTAFTVAHSITLIASAYNFAPDALWFPPLIETLIATSIVYMALENIVGPRLERRWRIAFLFGLVALVVGSFLVANTLAMTLSEQTREIGVRMALGALPSTFWIRARWPAVMSLDDTTAFGGVGP